MAIRVLLNDCCCGCPGPLPYSGRSLFLQMTATGCVDVPGCEEYYDALVELFPTEDNGWTGEISAGLDCFRTRISIVVVCCSACPDDPVCVGCEDETEEEKARLDHCGLTIRIEPDIPFCTGGILTRCWKAKQAMFEVLHYTAPTGDCLNFCVTPPGGDTRWLFVLSE